MKKILECHSQGDKRFSPLFARVKLFGEEKTIEEWYQLSKRFGKDTPEDNWRYAKYLSKFSKITHCNINGINLCPNYLIQWYRILWLKYLDENPNLVEYASQFDDFYDKFKEGSEINQEQVIRQYIKQGRKSLLDDCDLLLREIGHSFFVDTHELKIWPEYFQEVLDGNKTFELRKNDRNFKYGDILLLKEYDPKEDKYTGYNLKFFITYILELNKFIENSDYIIISFNKTF